MEVALWIVAASLAVLAWVIRLHGTGKAKVLPVLLDGILFAGAVIGLTVLTVFIINHLKGML